jgi:hypothetical protein
LPHFFFTEAGNLFQLHPFNATESGWVILLNSDLRVVTACRSIHCRFSLSRL